MRLALAALFCLLTLSAQARLFRIGGSATSSPPPTTTAVLSNATAPDPAGNGAWVGHYGSDGYSIASRAQSIPGYVTFTPSISPGCIGRSPGPKFLTDPDGTPATQWCSWFGQPSPTMTMDIVVSDSQPHLVTFYLDSEGADGGTQVVTDQSSTVLGTQMWSDYGQGAYVSWVVTGHTTFAFQGNNAFIDGVFFDPAPPVTTPTYIAAAAGSGTVPLNIAAPSSQYSAGSLSATVTALPTGGTVTLADGSTAVTVSETLTIAQLTSLKFVPGSPASSKADQFTYTVTDTASKTSPGFVIALVEVVPHPVLAQPACTVAGMEPAGVVANDSGTPISFLVPRTAIQQSEMAAVVNDDDIFSVVTGVYWHAVYPASPIVHVAFPLYTLAYQTGQGLDGDFQGTRFTDLQTSINSQLSSSIQAIALLWTNPWSVGDSGITNSLGLNSPSLPSHTPYYVSTSTAPFTDLGLRPAMMVSGYNLQDVIGDIDNGAKAQQSTLPTATGYLYTSYDTRGVGAVRQSEFSTTNSYWAGETPSFAVTYVDGYTLGIPDDHLTGASDVIFYGASSGSGLTTNTYLPGAYSDNIISFGGQLLPGAAGGAEQSALDWIAAGVTGTYGTVQEPTAVASRFIDYHYASILAFNGNTMIEAVEKSVFDSSLGNFIGDPLARQFGTEVSFASGTLNVNTSVLVNGSTYRLIGASTCNGSPTTLQSGITISAGQQFKTVSDGSGVHPYYQLVTP